MLYGTFAARSLATAPSGRPTNLRVASSSLLSGRLIQNMGPLSTWFQVTPKGLEQGFTVHRPHGAIGRTMVITIGRARGWAVVSNATAIVQRGSNPQASLHYQGLRAVGADGDVLTSRLAILHGVVQIRVRVGNASDYPVTVDPTWSSSPTPAATLDDGSAGGAFGYAVAMSADGTTAIVAAPGVNSNAGAVYVFHSPSEDSWSTSATPTPTATLSAPGGATDDRFGSSIALSADGTTAIVGGMGFNASTGVAYVYHAASEAAWSSSSVPEATLIDPGAVSGDYFGSSVSLSADGTAALIGSWGNGGGSGAAYVFHTSSEGSWRGTPAPAATLSDGPDAGAFGYSVSISGDGTTALVGANTADGQAGSAYIFHVASEGSWASSSPITTLTAASGATDDAFGSSVTLSKDGSTALIGAPGSGATAGAAYVFHAATEGSWGATSAQAAAMSDPGGSSGDYFGWSVALSGDGASALVGAYGTSGSAGAAYVFQVATEESWGASQPSVATLTGGSGDSDFGSSAAISQDATTVLVGGDNVDNGAGGGYVFTASSEPAGTVPGAPTGLRATPEVGEIALSWTAPDDASCTRSASDYPGCKVSSYTILWQKQGATSTPESLTLNGTGTSGVVVDLSDSIAYEFAVEANDSYGSGAPTSWVDATPSLAAPPGAPYGQGVVVSLAGVATVGAYPPGTVRVSWSPPPAGGCVAADLTTAQYNGCKVTGYVLDYDQYTQIKNSIGQIHTSIAHKVVTLTTTSTAVGEALILKDASFSVVAVNHFGKGPALAFAVPLETVPDAPVISASAGATGTVLSWPNHLSESPTGIGPITDILIYDAASPGGESTPLSSSAYTIGAVDNGPTGSTVTATLSGLAPGTKYYFKVRLADAQGPSPYSNEVTATEGVPSAPLDLAATGSNSSAVLTWTAPNADGGSPVTGYDVFEANGGCRPDMTQFNAAPITGTSATVTGLESGSDYCFEVAAVNATGVGALSKYANATTTVGPDAPVGFTAVAGNSQVLLSWSPPAGDGSTSLTGYELFEGTASGGESTTHFASTTSTSFLVRNDVDNPFTLVNGTTYFFTVAGVNAGGPGSASEVSATPEPVPSSPQDVVATAGPAQVSLTWTAPASNGGSEITGYDVTEVSSAGQVDGTSIESGIQATRYTVTGLQGGVTYYFAVAATNASGASIPNWASATPTPGPPAAPTALKAFPGNNVVLLEWNAPKNDGGTAITGYDVYEGTAPGGESATSFARTSSTSYLVRSDPLTITNGTTYYFTVRAVSASGTGPASTEAFATPGPVPGAPTQVVAKAANLAVTLTWAPPSTDGGSAVTGYDVYEGTAPGGESSTPVNPMLITSTSVTVTGLLAATDYFFYVTALNASGAGFPSTEVSAAAEGPPGTPNDFHAVPGEGQVVLTWTPPPLGSCGPTSPVFQSCKVSSYTVLWRVAGATGTPSSSTVSGGETTQSVVTGLVNETEYDFAVEAVNSYSAGSPTPWLEATPQIASPPGSPRDLSARVSAAPTAGDPYATVAVSWHAPLVGGCTSTVPQYADCAVDHYEFSYLAEIMTTSGGVPTVTTVSKTVEVGAPATSTTFTTLLNGELDSIALAAVNGYGTGTRATFKVPLESAPPAPVVSASGGAGEAILSWRYGPTIYEGAVTGVQIYVGTSAGHEAATPLPSSAYAESAQLRGPRQYLITVKVTHLSARPYYFRVSSSDTAGTSPKSAEVVAAVT